MHIPTDRVCIDFEFLYKNHGRSLNKTRYSPSTEGCQGSVDEAQGSVSGLGRRSAGKCVRAQSTKRREVCRGSVDKAQESASGLGRQHHALHGKNCRFPPLTGPHGLQIDNVLGGDGRVWNEGVAVRYEGGLEKTPLALHCHRRVGAEIFPALGSPLDLPRVTHVHPAPRAFVGVGWAQEPSGVHWELGCGGKRARWKLV